MSHRDRLLSLLVERSLALGEFTLASGARSTYYIDARLTTMSAEGQFLVGAVGLEAVRAHFPRARWIGGLTLGADPLACAIAHRSWLEGPPLDAFTVRKSAKDHGTGQRIEGGVPRAAPVVIMEDTLTRGGSALEALQVLDDHGAEILGVLALVDREAGGSSRIRAGGHEVVSLFTANDILRAAGHEPGA
ncbi:MAG: orotate phosphoribosyltransferase [Gemmatimonadota bacterium]